MTLLLVMLHTGTMFAVIVYFWRQWRDAYFQSIVSFKKFAGFVVLATALTGLIGQAIINAIEKTFFAAFRTRSLRTCLAISNSLLRL